MYKVFRDLEIHLITWHFISVCMCCASLEIKKISRTFHAACVGTLISNT